MRGWSDRLSPHLGGRCEFRTITGNVLSPRGRSVRGSAGVVVLRSWCGAYPMAVVWPLNNVAVTDSRIGLSGGMDIWGPLVINKPVTFDNR